MREWWTVCSGFATSSGRASSRCFLGQRRREAATPSLIGGWSRRCSGSFEWAPRGAIFRLRTVPGNRCTRGGRGGRRRVSLRRSWRRSPASVTARATSSTRPSCGRIRTHPGRGKRGLPGDRALARRSVDEDPRDRGRTRQSGPGRALARPDPRDEARADDVGRRPRRERHRRPCVRREGSRGPARGAGVHGSASRRTRPARASARTTSTSTASAAWSSTSSSASSASGVSRCVSRSSQGTSSHSLSSQPCSSGSCRKTCRARRTRALRYRADSNRAPSPVGLRRERRTLPLEDVSAGVVDGAFAPQPPGASVPRPRPCVVADETLTSKTTSRPGLEGDHRALWWHARAQHRVHVVGPDLQRVEYPRFPNAAFADRGSYRGARRCFQNLGRLLHRPAHRRLEPRVRLQHRVPAYVAPSIYVPTLVARQPGAIAAERDQVRERRHILTSTRRTRT
jgi:hypothetical protein